MTIGVVVLWIFTGLIVGAVAHLIVPGHHRIGILRTILFGMVGALAGGIITTVLIGAGHLLISFIVALGVAALLISGASHPRSRLYYRRRRRRLRR